MWEEGSATAVVGAVEGVVDETLEGGEVWRSE